MEEGLRASFFFFLNLITDNFGLFCLPVKHVCKRLVCKKEDLYVNRSLSSGF